MLLPRIRWRQEATGFPLVFVLLLGSILIVPASGCAQNDVFFLHDYGLDTLMNWVPDGWSTSCPGGDEYMTCDFPDPQNDGTVIELDSLNPYVFHLDHDGCISAEYPGWPWSVTVYLSGKRDAEAILEVGTEACAQSALCDSQNLIWGPQSIVLPRREFCEPHTLVLFPPALSIENRRIYISIKGDASLCFDSETWPSQLVASSEIICTSSVEPRSWGEVKALYRTR
jgi:hypothetical protein